MKALAALALALAAATLVTSRRVAHADGDVARGSLNSQACDACHTEATDTPRLVGQRPAYLASQLQAFKSGGRENELMAAVAGQLGDADIADLAAYWSAQPADRDAKASDAVKALRVSPMTFPTGFPKGWTAYAVEHGADGKTMSKSYANKAAVAAARAGKPLPVGSAIMVVSYRVALDAKGAPVTDKAGEWTADQPLTYAAMESKKGWGKDVPELLRNATWIYNVFGADKQPQAGLNHAQCLACHKPASDRSYVFTLDKLAAAVKQK